MSKLKILIDNDLIMWTVQNFRFGILQQDLLLTEYLLQIPKRPELSGLKILEYKFSGRASVASK